MSAIRCITMAVAACVVVVTSGGAGMYREDEVEGANERSERGLEGDVGVVGEEEGTGEPIAGGERVREVRFFVVAGWVRACEASVVSVCAGGEGGEEEAEGKGRDKGERTVEGEKLEEKRSVLSNVPGDRRSDELVRLLLEIRGLEDGDKGATSGPGMEVGVEGD
jgi:hypothetical protein